MNDDAPVPAPAAPVVAVAVAVKMTNARTPISSLVGTTIRKRPNNGGVWKEGIIQEIVCDDNDNTTTNDQNKSCRVVYYRPSSSTSSSSDKDLEDNDNDMKEEEEEILPINDTLDVWIMAHKMTVLASSRRPDETVIIQKGLFQRSHHRANEPYTLEEFEKLLEFGAGMSMSTNHPFGTTTTTTSTTTSTTTAAASTTTSTATTAPSFLRILEDCRMIKTTSNPTENYGRMLPWAVHKIMQTYNNNNNNNDDDDDDDDNDIMSLIRPQQQRPQQQPPPPPPPPPVRLFNSSSILVDIGHGIGNSCFQAAYMFGCTTRGIECHKPRHTVAQVLQLQLQEAVRVHQQRDHMVSNVQKKKNKKKCSSCFCLFVETHVR